MKKVKRFDESFTVIGSNKDERKIKELNEGASDPDKKKKFVKEDVLTKVQDSEIMERKFVITRLNKVSSPDGDYLVIYRANGNFRAFNYLLEVLHIFDRQDLFHLYELVMKQYSEVTMEGIELILLGRFKGGNTMALELIRFVKKQIAELEPKDSDGDEKDL
ncbi:hypothetical protein Tco_1293448 [Tanacetum coccineum]